MESKNNKVEDIDPDYKINATALRKIEEKGEEETKFTAEDISKIISEEFDKELSVREKQLEEIEDKIYKAQKLLHLVRYVLITSYYNKKGLEYYNSDVDINTNSSLDIQSRIHPAVKKLLGKNASLEVLNSRGKRKVANKNHHNSEISLSDLSTTKKPKLEPKESCGNIFKLQPVDQNQNLHKNRKKTRYRIVVGNISKWMPSLENDNTTHKWMVYVRGIKEAADISHIVNKVVFYLHPSYKPHDIVEISNYPFHLSRRGWGEFPLRVQIFFKSPLNKPVSIVHNLKLDKTYTGRQTLGNETVVDLYLHDEDFLQERERENCQNVESTIETDLDDYCIKQELVIKEERAESPAVYDLIKKEDEYSTATDLTSTSFEHNYCYEEEIIDENAADFEVDSTGNNSLFDHTYSIPGNEYKVLSSPMSSVKNDPDILKGQQNNTLIHGLGEFYTENDTTDNKQEKACASTDKCIVKTFTTANGQPIRFLPKSFNKVLLSNGNIVQIQLIRPPRPAMKRVYCNTKLQSNTIPDDKAIIDREKFRVSLPRKGFKNMGEVLPYLFKRLPLWSKMANDVDFKCTYPFVATSSTEFLSWSIGKRVNSEWCRAKAIRNILSTETFPDLEKWNTKTFFMYGRSHGYSSLVKHVILFRRYSDELNLLHSCFSESLSLDKFKLEDWSNDDVDMSMDVETAGAPNLALEKNHVVDISDASLKNHCAFVKEAALDCGVILKPEEMAEGVVMNAAERLIFEAVKCFAEGLIRRSRHHLVCQEDFREEISEITVREVNIALNERSEIRSIMKFRERKREMEFFL